MKKYLIGGIVGLVTGAGIFAIILSLSIPGLMLMEDEVKYHDFDEAVVHFTKYVEEHGWKIPSIYGLQKSMKKFGKSDIKAVKVFELCHPDHAHKILDRNDERIASSLMPCRIAIYEKNDGKVYASRMNSSLMASFMDGVIPDVMSVASK